MSALPFFGTKEELILLIDIGNGTVSTSVGLFTKDNNPTLFSTKTKPYGITERIDSSQLVESLVKLLDAGVHETLKDAFSTENSILKNKKINRVVVSFSSPLYVFKSKHVHQEEKRPFVVHKEFINSIILREQRLFKQELVKTFSETSESFTVIETSILHTKINGYEVENSLNKSTNSFDAFICMSAVPDGILNRVLDTISKNTHIPHEKILLHTFPVVSFSVVRDHFTKEDSFLLVDVTGETTDLVLVNDSTIVSTNSFPCGRHSVIRQIATNQKLSLEIAESNLNMFLQNTAGVDVVNGVNNSIESIGKEFSVYLDDALATLSASFVLPRRVFVTANTDTADLFMNFLKQESSASTNTWKKGIDVSYLGPNELNQFCQNSKNNQVDEFVSLLAVFYKSLSEKQ